MTLRDQPAVRRHAERLAATYYPEMIPDVDKEVALLRSADYARVIGPVEEPTAMLVARTGDNVWATKRHASILLWYSRVPGQGILLMRDFKLWVREQGLLMAGLIDDYGMPAATQLILSALGFTTRGGALVYFPRGAKR